eukprot:986520-Karenia_brevis.AAC.1
MMYNIDGSSRTPQKLVNPGAKRKKEGEGGHALFCAYCQKADAHYTKHCPQKSADVRNEIDKCIANHALHGTSCRSCGATTH